MKEDILRTRALKAKEESEWTENETEQLIEYYKQNDILWNHSLSSYKDRNLKELSYTKLSELLPGRSHDNIKSRWNVLKTIFNREIKKRRQQGQWNRYGRRVHIAVLFQHLSLNKMRDRQRKLLGKFLAFRESLVYSVKLVFSVRCVHHVSF